jgi:hypothetical protein
MLKVFYPIRATQSREKPFSKLTVPVVMVYREMA